MGVAGDFLRWVWATNESEGCGRANLHCDGALLAGANRVELLCARCQDDDALEEMLAEVNQPKNVGAELPTPRNSRPTAPPPPARAEVIASRPFGIVEWMPGYWHWDDEWIWISGRWKPGSLPPRAKRDVRPPRPPDHDSWGWSAGFWQWDGRRFTWVSGGWLRIELR